VLVATYNQGQYIRQTLDSLMAQTISSEIFEVIVINDGSADFTSEILQGYRQWARIIERENRGLVETCNEGLAIACGRYFTRVDSDDFVAPEWLEALVTPLQNDEKACCAYSDRYEFRGEEKRYVPANAGNLYSLQACGVLIRKEALALAGGFRPFYWEEYDLYLRLRQIGHFIHVPKPLYFYRKHCEAMTSSTSRRLEGWIELEREWGIDLLRTVGSHPDLEEAFGRLPDRRDL